MNKSLLGNRRSVLRLAVPFTSAAVMCFAFLPLTRAVNPAPDGGYPNANTAEGFGALFSLTGGVWNTAIGFQALDHDTTGGTNTAIGYRALFSNSTGGGNVAVGSQTLLNNTSGSNNIAVGTNSGSNVTIGSRNIYIGNGGASTETDTIRIGSAGTHTNTHIAGIHGGIVPSSAKLVYIDNSGHLGTILSPPPSSVRFKYEVKPMGKVSEAILALKPVTFRYKQEFDLGNDPQFGLVAEDVEKVNPDLVKRDSGGKPEGVRYEAVNAMLLNEFLKEHGKVEQLEASAAQQDKEIKALTATVQEQALQIQKVSTRIETSGPAPKVVVNE
jgi:hypothetical protein